MNIGIVARQFELTDAIKDYAQNALNSLSKYNLDIISVKVVISTEKKGFDVEFVLNLAKQDTIVIRQKDKDLYAAIDLAIGRASKVLRRTHDKMNTHKNEDEQKAELLKSEVLDEFADEIIPAELELYKPLEIEEALEKLKNSNAQFYVFNDIDAKMRVIYKRNDGKYGLY